jgi:hypothetical protein
LRYRRMTMIRKLHARGASSTPVILGSLLAFLAACEGGGDPFVPRYDAGETELDASGESDGSSSLDGGVFDARIPDPPARACGELGLTYAGAGCSAVCKSVVCECRPFRKTLIACHQSLGCLIAVDCDVACELDLKEALDCASDYVACSDDGACKAGRCAQREGDESGECTTGVSGAYCVDDGDCLQGSVRGDPVERDPQLQHGYARRGLQRRRRL